MVPFFNLFMALLYETLLGRTKACPNEEIMSFLHGVMKRPSKRFVVPLAYTIYGLIV